MAYQIIVEKAEKERSETALNFIWDEIEVFEVSEKLIGVSIPTKVLDTKGEDEIIKKINSFRHYNLWEGKWKEKGNS